ncbi:hypothetical protein GCM10018771_36410 [Streptomyces cellulosae]|nr:hypothetical protein GCM10018771_36410 [Streptomyces cellulosae]
MLLSHRHAARSPGTGEPVVHREGLVVVQMRQASRHRLRGAGPGDGGNAFAFTYVPPETEDFPEPPKERERHAGHCDDVQHHVVRLLPPAEEPAGP